MFLSSDEISQLVNNPTVKSEKQNLSDTQKEVKFSISLRKLEALKTKLENGLSIDLSQTQTIPMRWIRGDTPPHIDRGDTHFNNTYLIYLTDSIGDLIIDGQPPHSIIAGESHVFSEGVEHYTINTGNSERLMIGPMNENGGGVGAPPSILYFGNETDATNEENYIGGFFFSNYTLQTVEGFSAWIILKNQFPTEEVTPTPNGGPYYANDELIASGYYYVYPYIAPPPPPQNVYMGSLFTNNAQVFYKQGSLSTGGGGNGVRNSRHKQRRT